jgi:hypothetical protein
MQLFGRPALGIHSQPKKPVRPKKNKSVRQILGKAQNWRMQSSNMAIFSVQRGGQASAQFLVLGYM